LTGKESYGKIFKNAIGILVAACESALLTDYGFARLQSKDFAKMEEIKCY